MVYLAACPLKLAGTRLSHCLPRPRPSRTLSVAYRIPGCYFKLCHSRDEALVTEYVRIHTSIPVPKILDVVQIPVGSLHPYRNWLMISAVLPGVPLFLGGHRLRGASEQQVQRVSEYLRDWIGQLRNLQSPFGQRVCGFTGGSFRSFRIENEFPVGPFTSIADFHAHESLTLPEPLASDPHLARLVSARKNKSYRINLVHGDLLLHNILADSDLRPTGLVDWECAGWMPEYWETVASSRSSFVFMWCWKDIRREAFPAYEAELELDKQVQISHGE
ncbi:hypothetical protein B0H15DRAFT_829994 [Mycena belliarum]|uniref:Aminoglycoside phosphotransferase domain-containing protein n=1 Tax=Mycena belliarum TaxID=1033014 RepID=A0AAD6UD38_9AGAR|nr:hypothetical protein B0H15DRAFT_829994 [Mycena belliae]